MKTKADCCSNEPEPLLDRIANWHEMCYSKPRKLHHIENDTPSLGGALLSTTIYSSAWDEVALAFLR